MDKRPASAGPASGALSQQPPSPQRLHRRRLLRRTTPRTGLPPLSRLPIRSNLCLRCLLRLHPPLLLRLRDNPAPQRRATLRSTGPRGSSRRLHREGTTLRQGRRQATARRATRRRLQRVKDLAAPPRRRSRTSPSSPRSSSWSWNRTTVTGLCASTPGSALP